MSNQEYYIWPLADTAKAQAALDALNSDPRLPLIAQNAKTGDIIPDGVHTTKWKSSLDIFVNDTVGFPRIPSEVLDKMGVSQAERDAFLAAYTPQILEFDIAWRPPFVRS